MQSNAILYKSRWSLQGLSEEILDLKERTTTHYYRILFTEFKEVLAFGEYQLYLYIFSNVKWRLVMFDAVMFQFKKNWKFLLVSVWHEIIWNIVF